MEIARMLRPSNCGYLREQECFSKVFEDALTREEGQTMLDEPARQRVKEICELILKEQDHKRFSVLIAELNQLLDGVGPNAGEKAPK